MENFKAFYEYVKGVIYPNGKDSRITDAGADWKGMVERVKSGIELMEIITDEK